jgi:DNA-binding transcriptional ArsR family regulator
MNPHELGMISAQRLCDHFRNAMRRKSVSDTLDAFAQLESRFQRLVATIEGSQKFLDDFLVLSRSSEVRSVHISDPQVRCAARLEYLLELAGQHAHAHTEEETLRQIVGSRERGMDLIQVLAHGPDEGMIAGDLAASLNISKSNLSPLLGAFDIHGIVSRTQQGKHVFVKLTPQARSILDLKRTLSEPGIQKKEPPLAQYVIDTVVAHIMNTPYSSGKAAFGVLHHALSELADQSQDPEIAGSFRGAAQQLKHAIGIAL